MSPALPITPPLPERTGFPFDEELDEYEGWAKANSHYWARDYRGYLEFFFGKCFPEPHSTKQLEDSIGWGLETTPETLAHTIRAPDLDRETVFELLGRVRCPTLVTQTDEDLLIPPDRSAVFAELTGAELVAWDGVGHCPHARAAGAVQPHAARVRGRASSTVRRSGPPGAARCGGRRRALFVSSPIGLGHVWRDVAIARELRALEPGARRSTGSRRTR